MYPAAFLNISHSVWIRFLNAVSDLLDMSLNKYKIPFLLNEVGFSRLSYRRSIALLLVTSTHACSLRQNLLPSVPVSPLHLFVSGREGLIFHRVSAVDDKGSIY